MTFVISGTLKRKGKRKAEPADFYIDAPDREDARWQVHHGVIEANVAAMPGAKATYDCRRLRLHANA